MTGTGSRFFSFREQLAAICTQPYLRHATVPRACYQRLFQLQRETMLGRGGDAVHQEPDSDDDASDGPPPLMDSDSDDGTGTAGRIQQQEEYDVLITACLCKLRHLFCNCHALCRKLVWQE